jgi:ribosomal protein L37AE/L43A
MQLLLPPLLLPPYTIFTSQPFVCTHRVAFARRGAGGAMATDNALCCAICFQPLLPLLTSVDPSEAVEALLCSHVFHEECIGKERAMTAVNEVEFRCPVCKLTTHDMNQSQIKARDEFGSEGSEVPGAGGAEAAGTERRLVAAVSEVPTGSYEEVPLAAPAPAQKLENRGTMDGLTSDQKMIQGMVTQDARETVFCDWCGDTAQLQTCRITHKTKGIWRCQGCRSKCVMLRKALGTWPPENWGLLDADQQRAFFQGLPAGQAEGK